MEAFALLFECYRSDLYAVCLKQLGDPSLAEDVVQEVFIKAFRNLSKFDRSKSFWPWLSTMAARMSIDLQRRRSFTHYSGDIGSSIDADESNGTSQKEAGSALDEVIASEKRAELWRSLRLLPKRQRRVFLLYVLDGWTCSEIAAAEGISVGAVHLLLFRARRKMRNLSEDRPLPAIILPFTWLNWKIRQTAERIRSFLGFYGDGLSSVCAQAICLSTVAMMGVVTSLSGGSSDGHQEVLTNETLVSAQSGLAQTGIRDSYTRVSSKSLVGPQQPVAEDADSLADQLINPYESATPENSVFTSIATSPDYENDRSIMALGMLLDPGDTRVLFVSRDGGGTWEARPSRLLKSMTLLLPSDSGERILAYGWAGLQQSDDGGGLFRIISPIAGPIAGAGAAISPDLGGGAFKVLIAASTPWIYDSVTNLTQPAPQALPLSQEATAFPEVAFSPRYQHDNTIFISGWSSVRRCSSSHCAAVGFPNPGAPKLEFPKCGSGLMAYAHSHYGLYVTHDGTQTFEEVPFPIEFESPFGARWISDMAISCQTPSQVALFVSAGDSESSSPRYSSGIYRSFDAGITWSVTQIGLPGFKYGAKKILITPTGRLLATGWGSGVACSQDGGVTWARRCTPEF